MANSVLGALNSLCAIALLIATPAIGVAAALESVSLGFSVAPETGACEVLDKRAGVMWRSNLSRFGEVTFNIAGQQQRFSLTRPQINRAGDVFLVESPSFVAFCATRWNGREHSEPTLFTMRSVDATPLAVSKQVRVFHGFGDPLLKLANRVESISRERVMDGSLRETSPERQMREKGQK